MEKLLWNIRWFLSSLAMVALLAGCSSGSGDPDGGSGDAGDGSDGGDGYSADVDLPSPFGIIVPEDITLCSVFREGRELVYEYQMLSQISLNAGVYPLDTDQDRFDLTGMIGDMRVGPERRLATPVGPGDCTYELYVDDENPDRKSYTYECTWPYDLSGTSAWVEFKVSFYEADGQLDRDRVIFAEPWVSYPRFEVFMGPGTDYNTEIFQVASCRQEGIDSLYRYTVEVQNGDVLKVDLRKGFPPSWYYPGYVGETMPCNLVRGEATIGGETRVVEDYYHLVYAAAHHNAFEAYLVLFDPPIGDVHGIYGIGTGMYGDAPPEELHYLGSELDILNPVSSSAVVSYTSEQLEP